MHIAHLELARDYISAGLLDRAERLLLDLVDESDEQRDIARHHLVEIYRSESEWGRAIEEARALRPRKSLLRSSSPNPQLSGQPIRTQLAHFYCEEALETYTLNAAISAFEEQDKGTLTPGKYADIVVLSKDIMTVPAEEIREARVDYTLVGGKIRYQHGED